MTKRAGNRVTGPTCITEGGKGKPAKSPFRSVSRTDRYENSASAKVMKRGLVVFLGNFGVY